MTIFPDIFIHSQIGFYCYWTHDEDWIRKKMPLFRKVTKESRGIKIRGDLDIQLKTNPQGRCFRFNLLKSLWSNNKQLLNANFLSQSKLPTDLSIAFQKIKKDDLIKSKPLVVFIKISKLLHFCELISHLHK